MKSTTPTAAVESAASASPSTTATEAPGKYIVRQTEERNRQQNCGRSDKLHG
jgi:hypothetical protein